MSNDCPIFLPYFRIAIDHWEYLTGDKRREWMGCWGLLGVAGIIIDSDEMDHSRKFPA